MGGATTTVVLTNYSTFFGFFAFFSGGGVTNTTTINNIVALAGTNNLFVFNGNGTFEGNLSTTMRDLFRVRGIPAEAMQVHGAHDMMTAGQLFTIFARDYLWTNYPPVWTATIEDKSVDENRTVTFTVPAAADTDGTVLTYSTDPLPAGASFNPETREFSWTPDYTQAGVYPIVFKVSDGENVVSEEMSITVNDVPATDQIAGLKEAVAGMDISPAGIKNALTVKLDQALKQLSKDKPAQAVQALNAFINQVNALTGKKLTEEQATELINAAEEIILNITSST